MKLAIRLFFFGLCVAAADAARAQFTPNDPFYSPHEWYAATIGLPDAWAISRGSTAVTVAILDTGVMTNTPDLAGRLLTQLSTTGTAPFSDATLAGNQVLRHGTWVASAAAMEVNNSIGGAGIGTFTILPITITNNNGNNSSQWIADAIHLAADQGARVINISSATLSYGTLDTAAAYARTKGALTFVAGGNADARVTNIADYSNLIFVSGTNRTDGRWTNGAVNNGSSWGPYIDLSAPADDILVADPTLAPNGYGIIDGTSFASPIAAGVAGLAWSINPNLTPDEVQNMLFNTAVDLGDPGRDEVFGWGRINAAGVAAAALASLPVPEPSSLALLAVGGMLIGWRARRRKKQ